MGIWPSWRAFIDDLKEFEKTLSEYQIKSVKQLGKIQSRHPIIVGVILRWALGNLDKPYNEVTQNMLEKFTEKSGEEDLTTSILHYLQKMERCGEEQYDKIGQILMENSEIIKNSTSQEKTLSLIQEILITSGDLVNTKLILLRDNLNEIGRDVKEVKDVAYRVEDKLEEMNEQIKQIRELYKKGGIGETAESEPKKIPQDLQDEIDRRDEEIQRLEIELKRVKQDLPLDIDYLLRKGVYFYYLREYDKAVSMWDLILEKDPKNVDALFNKGVILTNQGKHDAAISYYNEVLEIDPKYLNALYNKGSSLATLGKENNAIPYFDEVLKINPKHFGALYNKGLALYSQIKYDKALSCFDEALKIDPKNVDALIYKSIVLELSEKYDDALLCYNEALSINPKNVVALNCKGTMLGRRLERFDEAISCFDEVLKIDPKNETALINKDTALMLRDNKTLQS